MREVGTGCCLWTALSPRNTSEKGGLCRNITILVGTNIFIKTVLFSSFALEAFVSGETLGGSTT